MKTRSYLVCLILFIVSVLIIVHLGTTDNEFARNNINWNGTSIFFSDLQRHTVHEIYSTDDLSGWNNTTFLLIAPRGEYSSAQITSLRDYVHRGNTLFLADDFGSGDSILKGVGSSITIKPDHLLSLDQAYRDPALIVISPIREHPLTEGIRTVVLDHSGVLQGGEVLMQSSLMSWVDKNLDRRVSSGEPFGRYATLTWEKAGMGDIVVLSDPSIFINAMSDLDKKWDNEFFLKNILNYHDITLVEQMLSRTADVSFTGRVIIMIRTDQDAQIVIIIIIILLIGITMRRRMINSPGELFEPERDTGEDTDITILPHNQQRRE